MANPNPTPADEPEPRAAPDSAPPDVPNGETPTEYEIDDPNKPPGTWSAMSDAANAGLAGIKVVE